MTLQYPEKLDTSDEYVIFQSHEYRSNQSGKTGPSTGEIVRLYMPSNTPATSQENGFNQKNFVGPMGNIVRGVFEEVGTAVTDENYSFNRGSSSFLSRIQGASNGNLGMLGDTVGQQMLEMGSAMVGSNANAILNLSRNPSVYNPNVELLYQGPKVRGFGFNFPMQPTSSTEAQKIAQIIKHFKIRSAAEEKGNFLKIPDVWQVTYMKGGSPHPYLNQFKLAVCTNVIVTTGSGIDAYASFADGFPINATMNLSFSEVDVILRKDHQDSTSQFGY